MLREAFTERLKAGDAGEGYAARVSTVRLILAALKDATSRRAANGNPDGIADPEILRMLQGMIKQRRESIELYEKGNRPELAAKERGRDRRHRALPAAADGRRRDRGRGARRRSPRPAPPASRTWAGSWRRCASAMPASSTSPRPRRREAAAGLAVVIAQRRVAARLTRGIGDSTRLARAVIAAMAAPRCRG